MGVMILLGLQAYRWRTLGYASTVQARQQLYQQEVTELNRRSQWLA